MRKGYPMDIIFALLLLLAFGGLCFFIRFCEIQTKDTRMIFLLVLSLILALYLFYALLYPEKF
ncbi:K(+)-transporting ATPase subunit F [Campylobacter jejuni]|nr:K(+)-transporting ATPase subunit F [Campylobacter jejuni]